MKKNDDTLADPLAVPVNKEAVPETTPGETLESPVTAPAITELLLVNSAERVLAFPVTFPVSKDAETSMVPIETVTFIALLLNRSNKVLP